MATLGIPRGDCLNVHFFFFLEQKLLFLCVAVEVAVCKGDKRKAIKTQSGGGESNAERVSLRCYHHCADALNTVKAEILSAGHEGTNT